MRKGSSPGTILSSAAGLMPRPNTTDTERWAMRNQTAKKSAPRRVATGGTRTLGPRQRWTARDSARFIRDLKRLTHYVVSVLGGPSPHRGKD